ncbi:MAG: hypothetical protein U1A78_05865 [Polyangia bacterium]
MSPKTCRPKRERGGRRSVLCAAGALALGLVGLGALGRGAALAGPVKSVRVTTYQELAEGQEQGVIITSLGDVRLGAATARLALPVATDDSVRALVAAADGTVYVGTGGEAAAVQVYQKGQLRKHAQLPAGPWVTALCVRDGAPGHVLAATAQDGRIFDVGPDGKVELWGQVEAEHVWGLLREGTTTYVATGPGALYALDDADAGPGRAAQNKAKKIFSTPARQFLALARGEDGALYVGTADDAVLYRIEPPRGGKAAVARAVHDFAGNEVRAIVARAGQIFVAVNDMQRGETQGRGARITTPPAGTAPGVKAAPPSSSSGTTPPQPPSLVEKKGKGALFRIDEAGRVEQLHAVSDGFYNALALDAAGNLFAAASTPGGRARIYQVLPDRTVVAALEFKEGDALALSLAGERLVGTGNSAALYRVLGEGEAPRDAAYLSKVFDASAAARWGTLRFLADGGVRVETRSGNLQKPDSSWSGWQALAEPGRIAATGEQLGRIASPAGRYLQARFLFGAAAVLKDFTVHYQPVNLRPRITEVLVGEDPLGRAARGRVPGSHLRSKSTLIKIRWKVENPDEDELSYRVAVRAIGGAPAGAAGPSTEPGWLRLSGPDPIGRTELDWNTDSLPDGLYEMKVSVSDERANPPELALSHELVSAPFVIDNRRPELRDVRFTPRPMPAAAGTPASAGVLSGSAVDGVSAITELSFAVDGGEFFPIAPRDGVLDGASEDFQVRLPALPPGAHAVLVRTMDAADNVTTVQLVIQVR